MNNQRAILLLSGFVAVLSLGIAAASVGLEQLLGPQELWIRAVIGMGLLSVILFPVAIVVRRELLRLTMHIRQDALDPGSSSYRAPFWMRAIKNACEMATSAWAERCEQLRNQIREIEVRRKVSEAERAHCEAVLHSLRDAVFVTDAFNEVTMANERAAQLFGFQREDAIHRPIEQVLRDDTLRRMITEARQSGIVSKEKHFEHTVATHGSEAKGAAAASFDVSLACLPDEENKIGGVVTIVRDVTREKEISQMKSDFVSQASHELRTPLSSINAYIEMLLDSEAKDEESRQEFYNIIKAEADRVSRMIDNMLNISRIEAGIVAVERTEVDFVKVANEVVDTLQPQAMLKDIRLNVKAGPLVYTAEADRDMMHQVVMNLVGNAIKYTPEGGRVTVSVENDDAMRSVLLSVNDTGLGIPPDSLDKIFDKFYRIESYKRVAKGTGLGLNLVKHVVETVHAGKVGVESEVGMGSRFWIAIPYVYEGS